MQNKQLVVEFLLPLKVFPIDLSMTVLVSKIYFFETDITKDGTNMSSSFCCDLDVAACEYYFSIFLIMLLYNKE